MNRNGNWQDQVFPRRRAEMKAEGREEEVAQASEHCFSLLTRPSSTWCNDSKPDKAGQQNIQTLFCPPLIAIVVIQSSNPPDAHHWFVFIPLFLEQAAGGYFIQLSRPLDVPCCHSKPLCSVEALTRSNLASSSLPYVRASTTGHKFPLSLSIDSNEMPTQPPPSSLNNRQVSPYWRMRSPRFQPLCHSMNWTQYSKCQLPNILLCNLN